MSVLLRLIMVFVKDDKFTRLHFLKSQCYDEAALSNASLDRWDIE